MTTYLTGSNITFNDGSSINSAFAIWYAINKTTNGWGIPGDTRNWGYASITGNRYLGPYAFGPGDSGWRAYFSYQYNSCYGSAMAIWYSDNYGFYYFKNVAPSNSVGLVLNTFNVIRQTDDSLGWYWTFVQNGTEVYASSQWNIGGCWGCVNGFPYAVGYQGYVSTSGSTGGFRFYGRIYGGCCQQEGVGTTAAYVTLNSYY